MPDGHHVPEGSGLAPGTELGRYVLGAPLAGAGPRWSGRDSVLDREVVLLIVPAGHPHAPAVLDAARRAAGVDSPRLVRVLDVGSEGGHVFVAEDGLGGHRTLREVLTQQRLDGEEVRRVVGEAATGIESARARGLHHLALTPSSVLIGDDGTVRVRGLATEAALAGDETEDDDAAAADATGLVALAYAGLTGTWPLAGNGGLPPAMRAGGPLPSASQLAPSVPGDLDTICRETLTEDAGPDSPGDLAAQIAPWSAPAPLRAAAPADGPRAAEDTQRLPVVGAAPASASSAATATSPGSGEGGQRTRAADVTPDAARPAQGESRAGATDAGASTTDAETSSTGTDVDASDAGARPAGATAAATAGAVLGAAATGGKVIGERLGTFARTASERSRDAVADHRARREALKEDEARSQPLAPEARLTELDPPAPLLPAGDWGPPSRDRARKTMAIFGAALALSLIAALIGVSRIGSQTDVQGILGGDETTAVATSQTSGPSGGATASWSESGSDPFGILSAVGYDPSGDGAEHNAEAQRVYDGDPATTWSTEGYTDPNFGNKPGVGVVVDLGQPRTVSSVTLQLPTTADVSVYAGPQPTTESQALIGTSKGREGEMTLTAPTPVEGQFVTVWFTTTVQSDDGRHRAELGEITVR